MTVENEHGSAETSVAHEERDVTFRPIVLAGLGLATVIVIVFVCLRGLLGYYIVRGERAEPPLSALQEAAGDRLPPEPRLQTHPRRDLREQRASEDAILGSYGWVDREQGVVRIPIGRAMELLAQRGWPSAPSGAGQ